MAEKGEFTVRHARRMAGLMAVNACIFLLLLAVLQLVLSIAGAPPDPSFYNFYPIMAGLGVIMGFERWWGQEQGDYNPFHDR